VSATDCNIVTTKGTRKLAQDCKVNAKATPFPGVGHCRNCADALFSNLELAIFKKPRFAVANLDPISVRCYYSISGFGSHTDCCRLSASVTFIWGDFFSACYGRKLCFQPGASIPKQPWHYSPSPPTKAHCRPSLPSSSSPFLLSLPLISCFAATINPTLGVAMGPGAMKIITRVKAWRLKAQ